MRGLRIVVFNRKQGFFGWIQAGSARPWLDPNFAIRVHRFWLCWKINERYLLQPDELLTLQRLSFNDLTALQVCSDRFRMISDSHCDNMTSSRCFFLCFLRSPLDVLEGSSDCSFFV